MTRDGDVIEIGCHSGSKTWTLRCEDNKWIGVLGYCGQGENDGLLHCSVQSENFKNEAHVSDRYIWLTIVLCSTIRAVE